MENIKVVQKSLSGSKTVLVPRKGLLPVIKRSQFGFATVGSVDLRFAKGVRFVTEITGEENGETFYGYALCSGKDTINRDLGIETALKRLYSKKYMIRKQEAQESTSYVVVL